MTQTNGTDPSQSGRSSGPVGFGSGPVFAAGAMLGGAVLAAGWGVAQIAGHEEGVAQALGSSAFQETQEDLAEQRERELDEREEALDQREEDLWNQATGPGDEGSDADGGSGDSGRGDEDGSGEDGTGTDPEDPGDAATTYIIEYGDTLAEISGETGVPLDTLVEANDIQDPNLIYAGASLVIPPVN